MKIIGQDSDGRLVIDLEGEQFNISRSIPGESPVFLMGGVFRGDGDGQELNIINPRDPNLVVGVPHVSHILPTEDIKTDPIENRWSILDL